MTYMFPPEKYIFFLVSLNPSARSNATKPLRINTQNVVFQRNHCTRPAQLRKLEWPNWSI